MINRAKDNQKKLVQRWGDSTGKAWGIKLICVFRWICETVNLLIYAIAWENSIFAIKYTVYFSFRQLVQMFSDHEYA